MKLAIGINIFGSYPRQNRCIETLNRIASKHSQIELYNITHKEDANYTIGFKHLPLLERYTKDVVKGSKSKKPIAKDFFDILSQQDCDYFIFLNSDVLISEKAIKLVLKGEYETYSFSRHDVYPLTSLDDKIIPFRIEIAGFDAWAVKKSWWLDNRDLFDDYIYAEPCWDVFFAVIMYAHSNSKLCNKEFYLAHEKHALNWDSESVEGKYNHEMWLKNPYNKNWNEFIFENIIKRPPYGQFLHPLQNEEELERNFLKK